MPDISILITRPQGDEAELTEKLHVNNYRVIHEPLTEVLLRHDMRYALQQSLMSDPDAIIVTSRHGAQALALMTEMRDMFLLCVGEATAATARSLGFDRVSAADGNVASLIGYIREGYDEGSHFLYISGDHVRSDLAKELPEMNIERVIGYETTPADRLSDTLTEQLRRGQIQAVTLFSQRTATIFLMLLTKAGLREAAAKIHAVCLSKAVAEPLAALEWASVHVAREATLASVVDCVDNAFSRPESQRGS